MNGDYFLESLDIYAPHMVRSIGRWLNLGTIPHK
jgi:hypothetical protein